MSFSRFASVLAVSLAPLLAAAPAHAFCTPDTTSGVVCLNAADDTCSTLGTTTMDGNRQNLIACMGTTAGSNCASNQCVWKSMTSSEAAGRSTITALTAAACSFTNSTTNGDVNYHCAIPANATHLKISASCRAIGVNAEAWAKAYFTPSSEPLTSVNPQFVCAAYASVFNQSTAHQGFHLVPVPKNVSTITIMTEKDNNTYDRDITVSILPLIVE